MPFWKKMFNKRQGVYYPRAVDPAAKSIFLCQAVFSCKKVWLAQNKVVLLQH